MAKMRIDIEAEFSERDTRLYVYPCQAHVLNLICKELDKGFSETTSQVCLKIVVLNLIVG